MDKLRSRLPMLQRYVGIILPNSVYDDMSQLSANYRSMFQLFEEAGLENDLIVCYFTFYQIKPGMRNLVAYVKENEQYTLKEVPRPKVVYSRVLDFRIANRNHIKSLLKDGIRIFNIPNYDIPKYTVHQQLANDPSILPHLPHSELITVDSLKYMMIKYDKLFLKKNFGEFGFGAMKLERIDETWCLSYKPKGIASLKTIYFKEKLPKVLLKRLEKTTYLVQELIPLATYHGRPFDMRVATQKDRTGQFQISAIMCKVARNEDFLTNGAQGGISYILPELAPYTHPDIPYPILHARISKFALNVANYLDKLYPHLADLGFDIGITKDGKPYFIECNFICDYVHGLFSNGQLKYEAFRPVFTTPIDYAKYLDEK